MTYYAGGGGGGGPFGSRIGPIAMPQPAADLAAQYPNLSASNIALSGDILSQLKGELSPETIRNIVDLSAAYGVSSGMPGSGLARNLIPRDIGLSTETLEQQGLQSYESALPIISRTQTVTPELQAEIEATNAYNMAAPDPASASAYAMGLYERYLNPPGSLGASLRSNPALARALQLGGGIASQRPGGLWTAGIS